VANVVLRDALSSKIGCGISWNTARDAEMTLEQIASLGNGLFLSRGGDIRTIVVVAAHEDEELGTSRLILGASLNVRIKEDTESVLRVKLRGHGVGDKITETRRLKIFLREPDVDSHDRDGVCC
jgi:hypothetical protein